MGLEVRAAGGQSVAVHAVPSLLSRAAPERLLRDLLGDTRGSVLLQEAKIVEAEHRLQSVTKRIDTLVDKMEEADETTAPILMPRLKERTA